MDNEDPPLPETTEDEAWYDAEIAPALAALAQRCRERGMAFVAVVEYQPGERAGTYCMTKDAGLAMTMLHLCARTVPNVDAYVINLRRHCAAQGIDTGGSFALRRPTKAEIGRPQKLARLRRQEDENLRGHYDEAVKGKMVSARIKDREALLDAGVQYGMQMLQQTPRGDRLVMEAHITGVLIAFWGALWGTFGTEYARGFIESQLRGMEPDVPHERFTEPSVQ